MATNPMIASTDDRFWSQTSITYGKTKDGALVPLLLGADGALAYEPPTTPWNYVAVSGGITTTTPVTLAPAAGVGLVNYLTSISVHNKHATVSTEFTITDTLTGATLYLGWAPALMAQPMLITFPTPIPSGSNGALQLTCTTTGTSTYVNASGYVEGSSAQLQSVENNLFTLFDDNGVVIVDDFGVAITIQ